MTFDKLESSRDLATPLELYLFETGSREYAYCNGDDDFVHVYLDEDDVERTRTYLAVPIDRDRITSSGALDRSTLIVRLADTTDMAAVLRGYPVSSVITLTIRQGHRADLSSTFLVAWAGRVLSARGTNEGFREISCQPASTSLKRAGLRRNWQYGCPHALYGPHCRADQAAATVTVACAGATANVLFVPSGWQGTKPFDKFHGGIVSWSDGSGGVEVRTILRPDATTLTLGGRATAQIGTTLSISLGCDHTMGDCQNLHVPADEADYGGGNIRNYGGQPFIPLTNPIGLARNY